MAGRGCRKPVANRQGFQVKHAGDRKAVQRAGLVTSSGWSPPAAKWHHCRGSQKRPGRGIDGIDGMRPPPIDGMRPGLGGLAIGFIGRGGPDEGGGRMIGGRLP
jgi:hypothetical protein